MGDPEKQGTRPLTASSPVQEPYKPHKRSKKRKLLCCCSMCCAIVLVIVIVLLILIFTVFKQKDPKIHVDSISLQGLSLNTGNIFTGLSVSVDLSLDTKISVKNPNYAAFSYDNSTAYVTYHGKAVADSTIPAGEVKARKTQQLASKTSVHLTGSLLNANLTSDVEAGVVPLITTVRIQGTAKVFGFVKVKHVKTNAQCEILVFLNNGTESLHCKYKVKV